MDIRKRTRLAVLGLALLALTALPCLAGEVAVLKNGFSIKHVRHEVLGDVTRLYVNADGSSFVDVPTAEIEHFEAGPEERASGSRPSPSGTATKISSLSTTPALDLNQVVAEASGRYKLDPDLVNSVIKAESDFKVHAISPKGAQGLMQLMPGTASQLGVPNAFDPQANVDGGTRYLRELLEKYNFDLVKALAAYNAGPQRVEKFGGVPPYYETRAYVARIVRDFNKKKTAQEKATSAAKTNVAQSKRRTGSPSSKVSRVSQTAESKATTLRGTN
ncbi:MAG TPA: lytic transglycosylase domain-containing protein [Candidatus Sulfotelmatobacter sp.]|nr:lytic transglycosylase domain-containing protein [Candidatus Sulfotelmatobacter sp.]